MSSQTFVHTNEVSWESGLDVVGAMTQEFRENLGPDSEIERVYALYWQKTLRIDSETSGRADLINLQGGYADLTLAYHDSVEECYVISGSFHLDGEGDFAAGDYFWRPPGWVHAARTQEGFNALLMLEGERPLEGSGPVSRRIRPAEEAGTNALHSAASPASLGPRGWVRCLPTGIMAWEPGIAFARGQGTLADFNVDNCSVKVLSRNPMTGGQSLLWRLEPGYRQHKPAIHSGSWQMYVLEGQATMGEETLSTGSYFYSPAGAVDAPLSSDAGALLFVKTDRWLDRLCT